MQKVIRVLFCVVLVVAAVGFFPHSSAKAELYSSYVSGITMVNLSDSPAVVMIEYIHGGTGPTAGTLKSSTTEDLAARAIKDYAAIPVNEFKGAVVISSSQPIAAMSTLTGGGKARGAFGGSAAGSKTVLLPFLAKNHGSGKWNTFFAVQNIGNSDTVVTVNYANCAGTENDTKVIKARSSVTFDQRTTTCLPNGITSAVVTSSTQDILAVVDQESLVANTALISSGFSAGSPNPVMPLVNANNPTVSGWRTAITIMNVGSQDTTLKLTYRRTDGTTCSETQTIKAQSSNVFAGRTLQIGPADGVSSDCPIGERLIGAAYVENPADNSTGQPLVAIVNQDRPGFASAYGSFDPQNGTPRVIMPLIMDNNGGGKWGTSFNVMNVGNSTTYVKCTFDKSSYVAKTDEGLESNGVFEDIQRGKLGVKITSAECKAYTDNTYTSIDTGAKIVAVVNERASTPTGDGLLTYEAINVQP